MSVGRSDPTILITGAAGNLGGLLARRLAGSQLPLRLMVHRTPVHEDLRKAPNVEIVGADLARPETLAVAVAGARVVVHFAGVLFAPRPERFLAETNTLWFSNLLDACLEAGVSRLILVSFPHVEGATRPASPATGRLDREPVSAHARTRMEEERILFERTRERRMTPVVVRLGMVYGRGILMIEAARWLARRRLLAVWRRPTGIHLVATADFLAAMEAAIVEPGVEGIYHVGDDQPVTLQEFLDKACRIWDCPRPHRLPLWTIYSAAALCEFFAMVSGKPSPLTRDFITIGRVSYWGDTERARRELIPELEHPTLESGAETLL
jgi:nucleoside-diphosphate-sugar epimerase